MPKAAAKPKIVDEQEMDFCLNAPEVSVWMACYGMINDLRSLEEAVNLGMIGAPEFHKKFNSVLRQLVETADITHRFDIIIPANRVGKFSPFFWRWFNWWKDYVSALTPLQVCHIRHLAIERVAATNSHRPAGHWIAYRSEPAFTVSLL